MLRFFVHKIVLLNGFFGAAFERLITRVVVACNLRADRLTLVMIAIL